MHPGFTQPTYSTVEQVAQLSAALHSDLPIVLAQELDEIRNITIPSHSYGRAVCSQLRTYFYCQLILEWSA